MKDPSTTRSSDARYLDQKGLFSFQGLCLFQNLGNWVWTMPGVGDNFLLSLHLPWPSTSLKVSKYCTYLFKTRVYEGQTLKHVGIWLRSDIFTHGQLYVASSRVGKPEALKFAVRTEGDRNKEISNVVFKEVLLWLNPINYVLIGNILLIFFFG